MRKLLVSLRVSKAFSASYYIKKTKQNVGCLLPFGVGNMNVRVKELMKGSKELQLEKQAICAYCGASRSRRCDWPLRLFELMGVLNPVPHRM